ncbi:hypothetical protein R9X47_12455 [Wukongibacter baidiensis]|uniref:Lin0368 family putative glycerol transporter subunit n=1 Tax=Wukongibacter baidiensis TaxID=1723361 RepID=UPI003D7F5BF7
MTIGLMISTFTGAFIFPFLITLCWGKMVESWGPIGGWMAAGFIVGTVWTLNHGVGMIYQSGEAWIDMAWAAGVGLLAGAIYRGASLKRAMPTVLYSILGGAIGAFVLSTLV